jgi:hypothetical protein
MKTQARGFVMIVVLMTVVALLAAVIGVQAVVQGQTVSGLRDYDQVRSRAIADHCLARARLYLDQVRAKTAPEDWDQVLDPNLNSHSGNFDEDFIPESTFGGSVVYVPPGEVSSTGLRQALHRYRYVTMDGGACLVRFDDNNDDTRVGQGRDNVIPIEGLGNDIPFRDRDIGIFITAISLFPVLAGVSDADAYEKAHARTTLRVFVNTGGAPGVVAHQNLIVQADVAICGQGGFEGDRLTYAGGGSATTVCACGDTATVSGDPQPQDCDYTAAVGAANPGADCDQTLPCQPGASATLPTAPTPDVKVPTPVDWLALDGFQDPRNPKGLGENGVCEFYFREDNTKFSWSWTVDAAGEKTFNNAVANDVEADFMGGTDEFGEIFVWDHTDNDAQGCSVAEKTLATCPSANVVTHNCTANDPATLHTVNGKPVVKRPCRWAGNNTTRGPTVFCEASKNVTPCWKLVARVTHDNSHKGRIMLQDYGVATAGSSVFTSVAATSDDLREDTRRDGTDLEETFAPQMGERVPNIAAFWGEPAAVAGNTAPGLMATAVAQTGGMNDYWKQLCGINNVGCPNCDNPADQPAGMLGWGSKNDDHIHFEKQPSCREDFFPKSILVFENQTRSLSGSGDDTGRFHVKQDWGKGCAGDLPVVATIIAQGTADIDLNTRLCGVWSDCTVPTTCDRNSRPLANGLVFRSGGQCFFNKGSMMIGDVQCGIIDINVATTGAECMVGNMVAFNDTVGKANTNNDGDIDSNMCPTSIDSGFPSCSNGVCMNGAVKMAGDLISDGDICVHAGVTVFGSVLSGGDGSGNAYIENNTIINGQLVSEGSIGIKNNTQINNSGVGIFGSRVVSGIQNEPGY